MIKLKELLNEELTKFPGDSMVKKILRGYKQYSHGPNQVGFVGTGADVLVLDRILKKYLIPGKNRGAHIMGYYMWGYATPASPYHSYVVSFDSSDGKTVRNFTASIIKE